MLFALWLACAGPESANDLDELLDRTEELEREVAKLRASREAPVVLLDVRCEHAGDVVTFPAWLAPTPPAAPSVGLWTAETEGGAESWQWHGSQGASDLAGREIPCEGWPLERLTRWVLVPL